MRKIHIKYVTYRQLGALAPVSIRDGQGRLLDRIFTGQEVSLTTSASQLKIRSYILSSKLDVSACGDEVYALIYVKFRRHPLLKLLDLGFSNYLSIKTVDKVQYEAFGPESYHAHDMPGQIKPTFKLLYALLSAAWLYAALFHVSDPSTRELLFLVGLGNLIGALISVFRRKIIVQNERFKWMASGVLGMLSGLLLLSTSFLWGMMLLLSFGALFFMGYSRAFLV